MAYTNIGRIRPRSRGIYNTSATYEVMDIVLTADRSAAYMAVQDVPAGTALTNASYWMEFVIGPQGAEGPQGEKGDTGAPGNNGNYWYFGEDITGTDTVEWESWLDEAAAVGDFYLNTEFDMYQYVNQYDMQTGAETKAWLYLGSIKGAQGNTGDPGEDGKNGNRWFTGTGITGTSTTPFYPSGTETFSCRAGDMYLNTNTSNVYQCTEDGSFFLSRWTYICNIKGRTGSTGATGPQGERGPQGQGITILGSYDSADDLAAAHPVGAAGDAYLVNGDLYVWSDTQATWENVGNIQGPAGYTPVRGTDYWTDADIAEIKSYVDEAILGGEW